MAAKLPPPKLSPGDELTVKWLNAVRNAAVEGSILDLGTGLMGSPTPNGWAIGLVGNETIPPIVFFCITPSSSSWGATGSWPTLTAGHFTADIYQPYGTTLTKIATAADVYNWFPSSPAVSKVIEVFPDGSGAYVTGPQSCT